MNTVARGLILPIVDWARTSGYACDGLFQGLSFDEAGLRGDVRRVEWSDYIEVHRRLVASVGGVERLTALIEALPTPSLDWLLRSLDGPAQIYRMWSHLCPMLWGCLRMQVDETADGTIQLSLRLPEQLPDATVWFQVCGGLIASMPQRIDLPRAQVDVVRIGPHAAEWQVHPSGSRDILPRRTPVTALSYVSDVSADYGEAMKQLEEAKRRLVAIQDPSKDFEARVQAATETWQLTRAQAQVLRGVVRGLSNKEIASELGNAEATVEVHVTRLLRKAGAGGRTALVTRFWGGARAV